MINTIQERIIKELCIIFDCPQVSLWAYLLTDRLLISIPFFRNNFRPQDARPLPNARCAPGELYSSLNYLLRIELKNFRSYTSVYWKTFVDC